MTVLITDCHDIIILLIIVIGISRERKLRGRAVFPMRFRGQ